ncbi:MAG: hypothetical protein M1819_005722 [Sarea resinae]|nr:MAG: hypothetical protein M1819_005722 [Sarea resinae]
MSTSPHPPRSRSPNSRKRSLPDGELDGADDAGRGSPVPSTINNLTSPALVQDRDSKSSSLTSISLSRSTSPASTNGGPTDGVATDANGMGTSSLGGLAPATKRRKLTFAEKEEKRLEKEIRDMEKAELKAKKDEEKRLKEEEKRKKEDEREEEKRRREEEKEEKKKAREEDKRKKEEEKRAKELEKQKREEEKAKKDKSQLRLNSFFKIPAINNRASTTPDRSTEDGGKGAEASQETASIDGAPVDSLSKSSSPQKSQSDYKRSFHPFFAHVNTTVAPYNRFSRDEEALSFLQEKIDKCLRGEHASQICTKTPFDVQELLNIPPHKRRRRRQGRLIQSTREIISRLHGSVEHPIDLTDRPTGQPSQHPTDLLKTLPIKYLRFAEDVRPPYRGTFTRMPPEKSALCRGRNPFSRALPMINYDYDSEAEWEEPEEGEDLDSEGEEEQSDDDGEEMEGFLDDEEACDGVAAAHKRKGVVEDLEPVSSGLCWEDVNGNISQVGTKFSMQNYKLEVILDTVKTSIDPFSTSYWQKPVPATPTANQSLRSTNNLAGSNSGTMDPPRLPLHAVNRTNASISPPFGNPQLDLSGGGKTPAVAFSNELNSKLPKPGKRMVAPSDMAEFKQAVQGSDLTKAGLVEVLKKRFPRISKDAIKDTLGIIAQRVGDKEVEKRWVILE